MLARWTVSRHYKGLPTFRQRGRAFCQPSRRMASFRIVEHVVRTQHTRDRRAGAERGRENELKLHVKQYIPETNAEPAADDVTIIGAQVRIMMEKRST